MTRRLTEQCQAHWQQLDIMDEESLKAKVREIFESNIRQDEALIDIYKLVMPEWDRIEKVHGYPEVGSAFWKFVYREFMEFDRKHHPNVFAGGLWLNNGFQSNSELDPWELSFANCRVDYLEKQPA